MSPLPLMITVRCVVSADVGKSKVTFGLVPKSPETLTASETAPDLVALQSDAAVDPSGAAEQAAREARRPATRTSDAAVRTVAPFTTWGLTHLSARYLSEQWQMPMTG